jgi:threonine dehydrogenase-like Zn-dependent dehydrogenase
MSDLVLKRNLGFMSTDFSLQTYAEYCRVPLETLTVLDEKRLCDELGYSLGQLMYAATLMVPYGGLRDINLQAGETVIVAPATGPFGGAAVVVALAMGAKVIAMGRNTDSLAQMENRVARSGRLKTVPITNDMEADLAALKEAAGGEADAYFDIGPREAAASTHFTSAILALRHAGRVSLMGGYLQDIPIPHFLIMRKSIRLQGKWMFERSDVRDFFRIVSAGLLDLGICEVQGEYALEEYREAWDAAADTAGFARVTVMKP